MRLLGLSGSLTPRSKTYIAVEQALTFAKAYDASVATDLISLRDYKLSFCDGRDPKLYEGDTKQVIQKIENADALIVGTPVYRGSYTGALKNVFDLIPNGALEGKVVGLIATGGTYHHFLAIEHQLKPLFGFFRAHVVPGTVYAHNDHYSDKRLVDPDVIERLRRLGEDVVRLQYAIGGGLAGAEAPPIPRKALKR
ncbi:NADPH-dependent FMN reductase [Novibacillus thermophilus]|uniref:NADPH-dependent FMN reductase n=1 Tax=Novibacillus thermophilus TaxID=1471761 RepID=A0A1U9K9I1_9BACL|nr:NAD(P)H-dependent oxidoreductase [Novibacillus thermophilus]AQS56715.1 NADPH-dependent FMN reductase [Novibacillus thermophilus]